jgi:hypothetical protein
MRLSAFDGLPCARTHANPFLKLVAQHPVVTGLLIGSGLGRAGSRGCRPCAPHKWVTAVRPMDWKSEGIQSYPRLIRGPAKANDSRFALRKPRPTPIRRALHNANPGIPAWIWCVGNMRQVGVPWSMDLRGSSRSFACYSTNGRQLIVDYNSDVNLWPR